jgi:hypothetical protein
MLAVDSEHLRTESGASTLVRPGVACRYFLEDVTEVHRRIPRERMRYALEIPYIARESSAAEILALRTAWARAAG